MTALTGIGRLEAFIIAKDKRRKRPDFSYTVTAAEQRAVRRAISKSEAIDMTPSQRAGLLKLANLWLRHRYKDDHIAPGFEALARMLDVTERTIIKVVRWAETQGFIVRDEGGRGRGRVCKWRVLIPRIMEVLAPNWAASNGADRMSLEGEISCSGKGEHGVCPYRYNKPTPSSFFPSAQPKRSMAELFFAGRWASTDFLTRLVRRLRIVPNVKPKRPPRQAHSTDIAGTTCWNLAPTGRFGFDSKTGEI